MQFLRLVWQNFSTEQCHLFCLFSNTFLCLHILLFYFSICMNMFYTLNIWSRILFMLKYTTTSTYFIHIRIFPNSLHFYTYFSLKCVSCVKNKKYLLFRDVNIVETSFVAKRKNKKNNMFSKSCRQIRNSYKNCLYNFYTD